MLRSALAVLFLLLATEVQANEIRLSGQISESLHIALKLTLTPSGALCWGGGIKTVEVAGTVTSGQYSIKADWDAGLCSYNTGTAEILVSRAAKGASYDLDTLFGTSSDGYTEFHDVDSLRCGDDPELEEFTCSAVREDGSSIIGNRFYFDPDKTTAQYHLDLLEE